VADFDIGNLVTVQATFSDKDDVPTDTTAVFKYKGPDDVTVTDNSPANTDTGTYESDVDLTEAGVWHWRWSGTGVVQAALEGYITVKPTQFP